MVQAALVSHTVSVDDAGALILFITYPMTGQVWLDDLMTCLFSSFDRPSTYPPAMGVRRNKMRDMEG